MSTRADKAVSTTIARAMTLLQDGYRPEPLPDRLGIYRWHRPAGVPAAPGESDRYLVDAINESCECEMFLQHSTCKHLIKCRALVALSLYILSPYLCDKHLAIARQFDMEAILDDLFTADQQEARLLSLWTDSDDLLPPPDDTRAPDALAFPDDDELTVVRPPKVHHTAGGYAIPRPPATIDTTAGFGSREAFDAARSNDFDD